MTVASESIDSEGFGTYSVTIDRTLPDGVYQYSVRFNLSNDSYLNSTVSLQVGDIRTLQVLEWLLLIYMTTI